jgi:uncharacterized lipoprotein YddW (UPF0748 family)
MGSRNLRRWFAALLVVALCWTDFRPGLAAQGTALFILRSPNQTNWETIARRIERLNLPYQTLPLADLSLNRLAEAKILFLPNVGSLSGDQVTVIQRWVQGGGRLIASGPLSADASLESRENLRHLLGGYWMEQRSGAARTEAHADQTWAQRGNTTSAVQGGLLMLSDPLSAAIAANWSGSVDEPAILTTPETVYLGWQWGSGPPAFDRDWLAASIDRFVPGSIGDRFKVAPVEATAMIKELEGMLGRVESALLTSDARSNNPEQFPKEYREAIRKANETLKALPAMISVGQDNEARALWENTIEDLWAHYPTSQMASLPEVRAIWLDRGTIVAAGSEEGLKKIFDRLAAAGINTVFFETINAGYPIYPSTVAPAQNPLVNGWDPLASGVKLAHERKIEIQAWTWIFATGNTRHNALIGKPVDYPGPVLAAHPDWAQQGRKGNLRPGGQPEYWLDPTNPDVRKYLTNLLGEIVERYNVDGVQFDYIRYPLQKNASQYFGYGNSARTQFQKMTGVDPATLTPQADNSLWQLWTRFRTTAVSSFVQETAAYLRQKKPNLILSAAVWPQANTERVRNLQQDWETWAKNGDVDLLVPMTYALNTSRLQQLIGPALEGAADVPVLFLPSLNLASLPQVQLRDQLQAIRDLPADGYSLFATAHLGSEHQQILAQATSPLVPYREPLNSALERFNALKREWDFLLTNNQVWVPEFNLTPWRAQTKRTQVALETLVKQPTAGWLKTAREEIGRSRQGLKEWLSLEKTIRPYRVKTWENRLNSMDALLHFAEVRLARKTALLP